MEYNVSENTAIELIVSNKEIDIADATGGGVVSVKGQNRIYGVVDSNGNKVSKPNHIFIESNSHTVSSTKIDISQGYEVTINLGTKLIGV